VTGASTDGTEQARPEVTFGCNEALDMARDALAKARRLTLVVQNALLNADLQRASSALRDLQIAMSIEVCGHGGTGTRARFRFSCARDGVARR